MDSRTIEFCEAIGISSCMVLWFQERKFRTETAMSLKECNGWRVYSNGEPVVFQTPANNCCSAIIEAHSFWSSLRKKLVSNLYYLTTPWWAHCDVTIMCHMTVDIRSYVDSSPAYVEVVELFPKTTLND